MRNALIIASVAAASFFAVSTATAFAAETKQVTRTVTIYSMDDFPAFRDKVKAVCGDTAVKMTDKAKNVCASQTFPKLTKGGTFRNAGVGGELNTLANQR